MQTPETPTLVNLPSFTLPAGVIRLLYQAPQTELTLTDLDWSDEWVNLDENSAIRYHEGHPFEFVLYGVVAHNNLFGTRDQPTSTSPQIEVYPLHREIAIQAASLFNRNADAAARDPGNLHVPVTAEIISRQDDPQVTRPALLSNRGHCTRAYDGTNLRAQRSEHPVIHPATIVAGDVVKLDCTLFLRATPDLRPQYHLNLLSVTVISSAPDSSVPGLSTLVQRSKHAT